MQIDLSYIPYEDKTVLYHLIQLYRYDSSEFDGHVLTQHGLYLYKYLDHQWTEEHRRPFLVKGLLLKMVTCKKTSKLMSNAR